MKIAIICNEIKPVPAVEGGAVETLVDLLIENNEEIQKVEMDVYSKFNEKALETSTKFKNTNFRYIKYSLKKEKKLNVANKFLGKLGMKKFISPYVVNAVKELKKKKYDWIIVENRPHYVGIIKRNVKEAKIALHLHNDTLNEEISSSESILRSCDKVLSVSNYINSRVREVAKTKKDFNKAVVLENKIDIEKFKEQKNHNVLREKYDISSEEVILLYHGRVMYEKGVLELVKAFVKAFERNKLLRLVIIGEVNDEKYKEKLNIEISKVPMNKVLMLGYIDYHKLPKYIGDTDIIILPSLWNEPFGLTIIESMAMRKPVISTNMGAIPEILSNNCGIVVEKDENLVTNLANEILELARDTKKRHILSENGRNKVVSVYNSKGYLSELIDKLKLPVDL
ncbi:glycosyltransferase family 4 protein [Priestia megaterium]|uniref:glycosyltransferase family 4 protein n=1 Tax=Priestia megaterium TaxID=1404 RepID=UPI00345A8918